MDYFTSNFCRLCGEENTDLIPIFGKRNLAENISQFLHIQVFVEDFLPHKICTACDSEVEHIVQYIGKCQRAQRELYSFKFDQREEIPPDPIKIECLPVKSVKEDLDAYTAGTSASPTKNVENILPEKAPTVFNLEGKKVELKIPLVLLNREKPKAPVANCRHSTKKVKKILTCAECPLTTLDRYRLNQHHKEVHAKIFSCDQCEKQFGKVSKLNQHTINEHTDRSPLSCRLCKAQFTKRYNYTVHVKTHMSSASLWPCDECGKQFAQMHRLDVHKAKCHRSKDLSCNQCPFIANHEYALKQHVREVHKKSFQCDTCGKQESKKSRISSHIQKKHMKKVEYQCKYCTTKYVSKKWYEHHIKNCAGAQISDGLIPFIKYI